MRITANQIVDSKLLINRIAATEDFWSHRLGLKVSFHADLAVVIDGRRVSDGYSDLYAAEDFLRTFAKGFDYHHEITTNTKRVVA